MALLLCRILASRAHQFVIWEGPGSGEGQNRYHKLKYRRYVPVYVPGHIVFPDHHNGLTLQTDPEGDTK